MDNITSKKMQIRYSKLYVHQSNKKDIDSDLTIEMKTEKLIDSVRNLSIGIPVDRETVELYALFTSLGQLEYGDKGLEHVNQILPQEIPKITKQELIQHNLKKIFKSFEESIGNVNFAEFCKIYSNDNQSESLEVSVLKLAMLIERVTQGVTKTVLLDNAELQHTVIGANLKLEEIQKIKEEYKQNKKLTLTPKLQDLLLKVERLYENCQLSLENKEELESFVEETIKFSTNREELLDAIYSFNSQLDKKKIRGK